MKNDLKLRIRVKLCGNCNPQYDVLHLLKKLNTKDSDFTYVFSDEDEYDVYLLINSCTVSCVHMPDIQVPKIEVSGFYVNNKEVHVDELIDYLYLELTKYKVKKV